MFYKDGDVIHSGVDRQVVITVVSDDRRVFGDSLQVGQLHVGCFSGTVVIEYHVTQDHVEVCFILQA